MDVLKKQTILSVNKPRIHHKPGLP